MKARVSKLTLCKRLYRTMVKAAGRATAGLLLSMAGPAVPAGAEQQGGLSYPPPRFPSYLTVPKSVDAVLPIARRLVRETVGLQGGGLGIAESGDTVAIVATAESEGLFLEAIRRAYAERGVKAEILYDYELVGVSREEALRAAKLETPFTAKDGGLAEFRYWLEQRFPNPEEPKAWLRRRRPDLYRALFPDEGRTVPAAIAAARERMSRENVAAALRRYLESRPDVRGIFWGKAGTTTLRRLLRPYEARYLGTFVYDNASTVMSRIATFPGDVWKLLEQLTIEPLQYVDRVEIRDPEGTDLSWELAEEMASRWARGVYQQGHLYMHPNQATGRFPYSLVDYPAFQKTYNPREPMPPTNGVIAGTSNHAGFYSRVVVHIRDGYLVNVEGSGPYAELWREFLRYPGINEVTYPYHHKPGYWWLYEAALGTHPKYFRDPEALRRAENAAERNRTGVLHFGHGIRIHHGPEAPEQAKEWKEFFKRHNLPDDHWLHVHAYFPTYRVRIRGTDNWVTLIDRGHLTALDHPLVRALASRYGNPDELLAEDWIPEIPGINVPGRYEEFARDPWPFVADVLYNQVPKGTYRFFYPPR